MSKVINESDFTIISDDGDVWNDRNTFNGKGLLIFIGRNGMLTEEVLRKILKSISRAKIPINPGESVRLDYEIPTENLYHVIPGMERHTNPIKLCFDSSSLLSSIYYSLEIVSNKSQHGGEGR